jgi:uncharacterized protein
VDFSKQFRPDFWTSGPRTCSENLDSETPPQCRNLNVANSQNLEMTCSVQLSRRATSSLTFPIDMLEPIAFLLLGTVLGIIGALTGVGGGFLLMPILVLLYPGRSPTELTALSLAMVLAMSVSGTSAFLRRRTVHVKAALCFAATAVPGAVVGVYLTKLVDRDTFELLLGLLLVVLASYMFFRALRSKPAEPFTDPAHTLPLPGKSLATATVASFFVGILSGLFGIGGGVIHVPMLHHLLAFPIHVATATSTAVLTLTSASSVLTHTWAGTLWHQWQQILPLCLGAVAGAQLGARLARKAKPRQLVFLLCGCLVLAGARIMWKAWS